MTPTIEPLRLVEPNPEEDHPACVAGIEIALATTVLHRTRPERRAAEEVRLSPMARRVAANKREGVRLVDEVEQESARREETDR